MKCKVYLLCLCVLAAFLSSCATQSAYYHNLNMLVTEGKLSDAARLAEKSQQKVYGGKNALLYYFDRGLLLHIDGKYRESADAFEEAKKISADYFTRSITTEASTLLVSDNMRPYYGEDFERAMVHVFEALDYVFMGQEAEALVEARQVDHFLTTLQVNYGGKSRYKEDAFIRYLTGMLYENQGETNDAFISYRQALDTYKYSAKTYGVAAPPELVQDALRTAEKLGFRDEIADIRKEWPGVGIPSASSGTGELVIFDYNGFSPQKIDNFFEIDFGRGWGYVKSVEARGEEQERVEQAGAIARAIAADEQVRIAFPKYVPVEYQIRGVKAIADTGVSDSGEIVENIGIIAQKGLEDRITRVRVRAIARGIIKYALARNVGLKVQEKSGELSGWIAKKVLTTASVATELSDKRSWRTLPDTIIMLRLTLPAGKHSVRLAYYDAGGAEICTRTLDADIVDGKKTFAAVRSAR